MNERRMKMIAELIKHLEAKDGEELRSKMHPPKAVGIEVTEMKPVEGEPSESGDKGPMEQLLADKKSEGSVPQEPGHEGGDEDLSDEDLEELMKLNA